MYSKSNSCGKVTQFYFLVCRLSTVQYSTLVETDQLLYSVRNNALYTFLVWRLSRESDQLEFI